VDTLTQIIDANKALERLQAKKGIAGGYAKRAR